jgi:bifunctional non-homologous end joining protein LigD
MDGTLKSWAVPKGMPFVPGEKRLAVEVEDHPVSYIDFEGAIPKGQYGGGTVMVWDRGTFETAEKNPAQSLHAGKLHFSLEGTKLRGSWHLVRLRDAKQWLLIKGRPGMRPISRKLDDTSARSGKSMKELGSDGAVWNSKPAAEKTERAVKMTRTRNTGAMPKFVPPMLAKPVATPPAGEWQLELKFDGYRALILKRGDEIRLLSRNEKDLGSKFPEILDAARKLNPEQTIIDGEIVAVDQASRGEQQQVVVGIFERPTQAPEDRIVK